MKILFYVFKYIRVGALYLISLVLTIIRKKVINVSVYLTLWVSFQKKIIFLTVPFELYSNGNKKI